MNRAQKIALTSLITSSLGLFLVITAIVMRRFVPAVPKIAIALPGAILACGVIILISRFKDKGAVTFDERDKLIEKNAYLAGFGTVYLLVILVSYVPLAIAPEARIPTTWFPFLLPVAVLCQVFAMSLAILIQYGWGVKGKNHE